MATIPEAPSAAAISRWLREARDAKGLARRAASVHLDVTERTIERWEDPDHPALPPADQFFRLVYFYGADLKYLTARKFTRSTDAADRVRKAAGE